VTPYYADGAVTLWHADCRDVLPTLDPVDLVFTSPPYNMGRQSGAYANMADGYHGTADDLDDADYVAAMRDAIAAMWRLTSPAGAVFVNHKAIIRDGAALLPTRLLPDAVVLRQIIVWDRRGGMNWSPSHFCPQHEWVMLLAHPPFRLTGRSASAAGDVWSVPIEQGVSGHPCPFPVSLPARAIYATSAATVLDPFAGSGSTLRAAKDLGRRAIGIERDERYCEIAALRMGQEVLAL
jgi:DNA modification methylase